MSAKTLTIGLDLSCLLTRPLTGVGYYTSNLLRAFLARDDAGVVRAFASSGRLPQDALEEFRPRCERTRIIHWPTRLKVPMWTSLEWPPIEWFTGAVDIAHGYFHLLPPSRKARRIVTVYDLTNLRQPDTHTEASKRLHGRMLRHAACRADAFIAISASSKADVVELLDVAPERVHIVYGGVCMEEFGGELDEEALAGLRQRLGIRGDYFIHLGTVEPRKNLPRLLNAYARARERFADCPQLVLAGARGWKSEPVFEALESLKLGDAVILSDYLPRPDAVLLLRGARACLYPSLYEGFGLPVLEAMAARTPVLTSNVSSLPEVIGDTGIQVDPTTVDAIEAGIAELLESPDAAARRLDAAYARAGRFTWAKSAADLAEVYRGLC